MHSHLKYLHVLLANSSRRALPAAMLLGILQISGPVKPNNRFLKVCVNIIIRDFGAWASWQIKLKRKNRATSSCCQKRFQSFKGFEVNRVVIKTNDFITN